MDGRGAAKGCRWRQLAKPHRLLLAAGSSCLIGLLVIWSPATRTPLVTYDVGAGQEFLHASRRLAVASPTVAFSSVADGTIALASAANVDAVAGVTYGSFDLSASSGLGTTDQARAKVVMASVIETECASATAQADAPLDGTGAPSIHTANQNLWSDVRLLIGGTLKMCYKADSSSDFELLSMTISVAGASNTAESYYCFGSTSVACSVQLVGAGLGDAYSVALLEITSGTAPTCGSSLTTSAFANPVSSVASSLHGTASTSQAQIHGFGLKASAAAASYVLCLCPGFQATDRSGGSSAVSGACSGEASGDFVQPIGSLYVTSVSASAAIYSGLAVELSVACGASIGGCATDGGNRYKVVDSDAPNDEPAWSPSSGCRTAEQTTKQIGPSNCGSAVTCLQEPDPISTALSVTWPGLTLTGTRLNSAYVDTVYDVCYCQSSCMSPSSWFKVGEVQVQPITVSGPSAVNTPGTLSVQGVAGSWTTSGSQYVREMKILQDDYKAIGGKECYERPQSTSLIFEGHECSNGTVDCADPYTSSSNGHTYRRVAMSLPGWVAVCYCDQLCTVRKRWTVAGRLVIGGPSPRQAWSLYTNAATDIVLHGWGLTGFNRIRILAGHQNCSDLLAFQSTKVTGPSPGLPALAGGAIGSITDIADYDGGAGSTVTFSTSHGLQIGDRFTVSGVTCGSCSTEVRRMFNTEHTVRSVLSAVSIFIKLGFPSGQYPTVDAASGGSWQRADVQTFHNVKIKLAGNYVVCWAADFSAGFSTTSKAGTITVVDPPSMLAQLRLSTIEPLRVAPVVISFTTSSNSRYQTAVGRTRLKIVFAEPTKLAPAFANGTLISANAAYDTLYEASHAGCGAWLVEVGAGGTGSGFPMPDGCYYVEQDDTWEFYIVLPSRNGLTPSTRYDIVMYARAATNLVSTTEVVEVWCLDDVDRKPFDVLELGRAVPDRALATFLRGSADPTFDGAEGFKILGSDTSELSELVADSRSATFQASVKAASSTAAIRATNIIRILLRPLLQWSLSLGCRIECTPYPESSCPRPACSTESLTRQRSQRNMLKLTLPPTMTPITDTIKHTISLTHLVSPPGGFFPTRWGVELQAEDGAKPHYVETAGRLLYSPPTSTVGSLVAKPGHGDSRPFRGDMNNVLYLKLVLGASLHATSADGDAAFTLVLPTGYTCNSGGHAVPEETLAVLSGSSNYGASILSGGSWTTLTDGSCQMSLRAGQILYAGSALHFGVNVSNPSTPLLKGTAASTWKTKLSGKGSHAASIDGPSAPLSGSNDYAGSVSVLGRLSEVVVTPSTFQMAAEGNWLSVFFRTEQQVENGGAVWVDAPEYFDFGAACQAKHLPDEYYAPWDASRTDSGFGSLSASTATLALPFAEAAVCTGEKVSGVASGRNRAKLLLAGPLDAGIRYGFMVRVANAKTRSSRQSTSWMVYTVAPPSSTGSSDARIDGSPPGEARMHADAAAASGAWLVADFALEGISVAVSDMRPTGSAAVITVFPVILEATFAGPLRVTAPSGWRWDFSASDFVYAARREGLSTNQYVEGFEVSLPLTAAPAAPTMAPLNVLVMDSWTSRLRHGVKYGFRTKIIVPTETPVNSQNLFIVQAGDDNPGPGEVSQVGVTSAPQVRRVYNAEVMPSGTLKNQRGELAMRFSLVTEVPVGGVINMTMPPTFEIDDQEPFACSFGSVAGLTVEPQWLTNDTFRCETMEVTSQVHLGISFPAKALPANTYEVRFRVRNPSEATNVSAPPPSWFVTSRAAPGGEVLDYEGTAAGYYVVGVQMPRAKLIGAKICQQSAEACSIEDQQYDFTGRNDRPGQENHLIFSITLSTSSDPGPLTVRGPRGFVWAAACKVVVATAEVFGGDGSTSGVLPVGTSEWPSDVSVSSCRGRRNVAVFTVSHNSTSNGLVNYLRYVFRIGPITNPMEDPAPTWSIEFGGEASVPAEGFQLWKLRDVQLSPRDVAQHKYNTVTLQLTPYNTVPVNGYLSVTAPGGFSFPTACSLEVAAKEPPNVWEIDKQFIDGDVVCEGSQTQAIVRLLRKTLMSGVTYVLKLVVLNPKASTIAPSTWQLETFMKKIGATDAYMALDTSPVEGFYITDSVRLLELDGASSLPRNGLSAVRWSLSVQLSGAAYVTDKVVFTAPVGYSLRNATGPPGTCGGSGLLFGPLAKHDLDPCSSPCFYDAVCTDNVMVWVLKMCSNFPGAAPSQEGLCFAAETQLRFEVLTQNPQQTPTDNRLMLRHETDLGNVLSSGAVPLYDVIPLLGEVKTAIVPSGSLNIIAQATGSETAVVLSFVPVTEARTVVLRAVVGGETFRFAAVTATDYFTQKAFAVNVREFDTVTLSAPQPFQPNSNVSILLQGLVNPIARGVSAWTITTYSSYHPVLGPVSVANERLAVPGFTVLSFITVLTISAVTPSYYGSIGATADLSFRVSEPMLANDELVITLPAGYEITSPLIATDGALHAQNVTVSGRQQLAGRYIRLPSAASAQTPPTYKMEDGDRYLFWYQAERMWIIGGDPLQTVSGRVDEAYAAIGGIATDPHPSVTAAEVASAWRWGSGSGWQLAPGLKVSAEAQLSDLSSDPGKMRVLTVPVGAGVASDTASSVLATVNVPTAAQSENSWLFVARRGGEEHEDGTVYATNDLQFQGFALRWRVIFTIQPALIAPRARSSLMLTFDQERTINALRTVTFRLTAPTGILFPTNCFSSNELAKANNVFVQCVGVSNTARLVGTDVFRIKGQGLKVELLIDLAHETPNPNLWTLSYFQDDSLNAIGHGEVPGFNIVAMPAFLKGNNQLNTDAPLYFRFRPRSALEADWTLTITPPASQGYTTSCWGLRQGTLPKVPDCESVLGTDSLQLILPAGGELIGNQEYVLAVGVTNAGRAVPDAMNFWSIVVRDSVGNIQDANYAILGTQLRSVRMKTSTDVEYTSLGDFSYLATIEVVVEKDLGPTVISKFRVEPPAVFAPKTVKVTGALGAALRAPNPALPQPAGSAITLALTVGATLPKGNYMIEFGGEMQETMARGSDPTWSFQAQDANGEVQYQMVMSGTGDSPFRSASSSGGAGRRLDHARTGS